ncbi:hypothetical protein A2303_07625 [Candidatus Falkowbacteria bacterium RIFOXYB2_FULL_47_14]|uniref:Uncharacterized protein n=1 Tax=Candidatus Falkowbacteria bacterium RIFOXYA2_FULL_47_19 TaxID=1797994 RepID=A0A1F5SGM6_9BACT|nr:MAG: hypothetical protein A2227_01375 [Candidatus Falkowbacteria bacterium RIFOXYA2_FULL_47_19]OGF35004.1 MAG: hypothetical protein A2468_07330 [Candidatus Falkowbacteria bacterium RIFOXYC2_FULL_46_15]OGF43720.1 MAG: hypothetical protein A2303_07625 [Candidatus Falkowbacteria bacterium RIFOXYB2_FULL_47_14]
MKEDTRVGFVMAAEAGASLLAGIMIGLFFPWYLEIVSALVAFGLIGKIFEEKSDDSLLRLLNTLCCGPWVCILDALFVIGLLVGNLIVK